MKIKANYVIIFAITFLVAAVGSYLTSKGMNWYDTLTLPEIAPDGAFIGTVWTIIYFLSAVSAILFWNSERRKNFELIAILFWVNAFLNVIWSFLFFTAHFLFLPIVEMILLNITNAALIYFLWNYRRVSAYLLFPYFIWVSFATYLAYLIYSLN